MSLDPPDAFVLDPRLAAASAPVAVLTLCEARLQDDARWPWLVLIPRRAGLVEIDQLPERDRSLLMEEAVAAGRAVRAMGRALGRPVEKLNTGALGMWWPSCTSMFSVAALTTRPGPAPSGGSAGRSPTRPQRWRPRAA
jgi:hypothetical protein